MYQSLKGRIVEIEKNIHQAAYLKQGIKKQEQQKYDNNIKYYGSNGSYVTGFEYFGTTVDVKIYIYDLDKCISFDIRDFILKVNGKQKISSKLLDYIIEKNKGKKVTVQVENEVIKFDMRQLDVII